MNIEEMARWLEQRLPELLIDCNLTPGKTRVTYVLNWGRSFEVSDGAVRYHLKLSEDADRLRAFHDTHEILERRYHAPALLRWIELPELGYKGLLQRHVDGRTSSFQNDIGLLPQLIQTADRLHRDAELRGYLAATGLPRSRLDYFVETFIDRFTIDLEGIEAERPAFISEPLLLWMQDEVRRLCEAAALVTGFHELALDAVHGDLHEGNILVAGDDWFIVDWDDLSLGDPALEFAILLWPVVYATGRPWQSFELPSMDMDFGERIAVCLRAQLLNDVIDTLSDYIDARIVPERTAEIQNVKRREHERALELYQRLWPGTTR